MIKFRLTSENWFLNLFMPGWVLELLGRENSRAQLLGSGIRLGASCQQCRCQLTYVTICLHCIFLIWRSPFEIDLTKTTWGRDRIQFFFSGISIEKLENQLLQLKATFSEKEAMLENLKTRLGKIENGSTDWSIPQVWTKQWVSCSWGGKIYARFWT